MRVAAVIMNVLWIIILVYNFKDFVMVGMNGTMLEIGLFGILYIFLLLTLVLDLVVIVRDKWPSYWRAREKV